MGMVRYFAKFNSNIGLFDTMGGGFKPLDLNKQDKELWVLISNHFSEDCWGDYYIVSKEYANVNHFQDEKNCRFFLPRMYLKRTGDDMQHHPYTIGICVSKPRLLCQYIDDVKYAYGLSTFGNKANFEINSYTNDIEDFKKIYSQFEEQVKLNEKELARYSLLKKKYDIYLKKLEIDKDFR
jgi:hypothetical protein